MAKTDSTPSLDMEKALEQINIVVTTCASLVAGVNEIIMRDDIEYDAQYAAGFVCRSVVEKLNALEAQVDAVRRGLLQREEVAA